MRARRLRAPSGAATAGQTRHYAERIDALVAQLRGEIWAPERPHGLPALVLLMGLPGVGKTHSGRLLAARLGAAHVASDYLRSRLFIAASYGALENATVFGCLDALVDALLAERHRVIVDATHLTASSRAAPARTAARRGVPLVSVLVVADERATLERLARRQVARDAHDHSDADRRVYEGMRARPFEPPAGGYLEVRNGPDLAAELDRVALAVEDACARAS